MSKFAGIAILIVLMTGPRPVAAFAQATPAASGQTAQVQDAAKKLFGALAKADLDGVRAVTVNRYFHKVSKDTIAIPSTGPKVAVAYDGSADVLRQDKGSAVVQAVFYKPESGDLPNTEIEHLRVFMVMDKGQWKASAPDKKDAGMAPDGGWYHPGSFTFCPNRGMVFLGNHFSNDQKDAETAVCR